MLLSISLTLQLLFLSPLLVPIYLFLQKKYSKTPSDWKYPPQERIVQFTFAYANLILSIPAIYALIVYALTRGHFVHIVPLSITFVILVEVFSAFALFRPKFIWGIILFYVLFPIVIFFSDRYEISRSFAFNDVCNSLRSDPECQEYPNHFICKSKRVDKTICINNTNQNFEYYFHKNSSSKLNETFETRASLLYIKNLPRNICDTWTCGFIHEVKIEDLLNRCPGCERPISTRLRVDIIPKGTQFKIIDSFSLNKKFRMKSQSQQNYFIVEDTQGLKSEIHEVILDAHLKLNRSNEEVVQEELILSNIHKINTLGFIEIKECKIKDVDGFIQSLHFDTEASIKKDETNGCFNLKFMTVQSYLTYQYFF